jgi:heme/copper-type cytochrome/quinol oxidase subunit 4
MKTREVLTITGICLLGLTLLCILLLFMSKKKKKTTESKAFITTMLFLAVSVLTVSQFMKETEDIKQNQ